MSIDATIGRSTDISTSQVQRMQAIQGEIPGNTPLGQSYPIEPSGVFATHYIVPAQVDAQIAANTFAADTLTLRLQADRMNAETARLNAETALAEAWVANAAAKAKVKAAQASTAQAQTDAERSV